MSAADALDAGTLLVIDTSGARCAVAVVDKAGEVIERSARMARGHAEHLLPMIDALLTDASVESRELVGIVTCTGPGGFTSVRVGVAAARGIALGLGLRSFGVDIFTALAFGTPGPVTVVQPGGGGRLFARAFVGGHPTGAASPLLAWPDDTATVLGGAEPLEPSLSILAAAARAGLAVCPASPLYLRPPDALPSRHQPPRALP